MLNDASNSRTNEVMMLNDASNSRTNEVMVWITNVFPRCLTKKNGMHALCLLVSIGWLMQHACIAAHLILF